MVFNFDFVTASLFILSLWVLVLSFFLWQTLNHYNKLTSKTSAKTLREALEKILENTQIFEKKIDELASHIETIEHDGLFHAQRIGLVRFNPFKDTGGNQSFVLAVLDGHDNGVVISSLHGRSGARWYAKTILSGKGKEHGLSEEEEEAIRQAKLSAGQVKEL